MVDDVEITSCQSLVFERIPDWRGSRDDSDTMTASSIPIISSGVTEGRAVKLYNGAKCCRIRPDPQTGPIRGTLDQTAHVFPSSTRRTKCSVHRSDITTVAGQLARRRQKWPMVMQRVRDYAATRLGALPEFRKKARENAIDVWPPSRPATGVIQTLSARILPAKP